MAVDEGLTESVSRPTLGSESATRIPRFLVNVLRDTTADGTTPLFSWDGAEACCTIGSHPSNAVVLSDRSVSRFHAEIRAEDGRVRIVDLDSTNGTVLDGVRLNSGFARDGSIVELGRAAVSVSLTGALVQLPLSQSERFGNVVGSSVPMRALFALLERAARSDTTVLIEGETGTGKEAVAEALHAQSDRSKGPLVVVDLGALPAALIESELFGHERGAFTGAHARRIGAFEAARGGTIFLDELGELASDLQPKLLRVLEQRTIRRVGSNERIPVDVRVIAATNRDMKRLVNEGTFRSDLYFRLAVLRAEIPPLRSRTGDLLLLVSALLEGLNAKPEIRERFLQPAFLARLAGGAWPGNVRELRNHLERCLVMELELPIHETQADQAIARPVDPTQSYAQARDLAIASFERDYLPALLRHHEGNVSRAAREAGIDRAYLHRLLRRHGLNRGE